MGAAPKYATRATVTANGDPSVLAVLAGLMDEFDPDFNIVTP